jgi:hypothetical protein
MSVNRVKRVNTVDECEQSKVDECEQKEESKNSEAEWKRIKVAK